jgi:hypothetical protein
MQLQPGDVYSAVDTDFFGYSRHYNIVVAARLETQELVLVYTGSDKEKIFRRCQRDERLKFSTSNPATFVELPMGWCPDVSGESAINCNAVAVRSEDEILALPAFKRLRPMSDVSYLELIKRAILQSDLVPVEIKKLLIPTITGATDSFSH